jgi:hypothetical protein
MRTIKMVADELGVTKQTIVNNAKSLNITFEKENGINYIDDNDYLKIIEKITKKESTIQNKESVKKELFGENTAKAEKNIYNNSNSSETLKTKVNELASAFENFKVSMAKQIADGFTKLSEAVKEEEKEVEEIKLTKKQDEISLDELSPLERFRATKFKN